MTVGTFESFETCHSGGGGGNLTLNPKPNMSAPHPGLGSSNHKLLVAGAFRLGV